MSTFDPSDFIEIQIEATEDCYCGDLDDALLGTLENLQAGLMEHELDDDQLKLVQDELKRRLDERGIGYQDAPTP